MTATTTSLRQFEDWGSCDDAIRSGFPAMHLSDEEIAARQAALDDARHEAARPTTYYDLDAQDKANFKQIWPERAAILEAPLTPVTPPPAISADPWAAADDQVREEMLLATIAQAQTALAEIRARREAAKRAAFEQARRQVRAIEDRQRLHQSHIESSERLSVPLSSPERNVELTPWGTSVLMR